MRFQPSRVEQLLQDAAFHQSRGAAARAALLLEEAAGLEPDNLMVLTARAEIDVLHRDSAQALRRLDQVLAIEPHFAPAWYHRAQACWLTGRQHDALESVRRAVDIQPPNAKFRLLLGQIAAWTGHGTEARQAVAPLLRDAGHDPESFALATAVLGELAIKEGDFTLADRLLAQSAHAAPNLPVPRMQWGMNQLRLGQFEPGWRNYAARVSVPFLYPDGPPVLPGAVWTGQDPRGKTLLIFDDQGHGDSIQFFRYLSMLRDKGTADITLLTLPPLVRLLAEAAPYATVVPALPDRARFDFHSSSTALPAVFGTSLETIPASVPYLFPPAGIKGRARRNVRARPNVGLVWSGDARHTRDHLRSVPAAVFLRLADVPGIRFHSLQHRVRPDDQAALRDRPGIATSVQDAADFADTAALIAGLDLVIAVDTAVAHLAAAMGKPVWIVLHVAPDWRWLTERSDSPWYPTVRLFRVRPPEWQPGVRDGGWGPVVRRVGAALRRFAVGSAV